MAAEGSCWFREGSDAICVAQNTPCSFLICSGPGMVLGRDEDIPKAACQALEPREGSSRGVTLLPVGCVGKKLFVHLSLAWMGGSSLSQFAFLSL